MKKILIAIVAVLALAACERKQYADDRQAAQMETMIQEATSQTGMPALKNFRERKLLKMIYELRDQEGLTTHTYVVSETGGLVPLCKSFGYAISDATGYTNPEAIRYTRGGSPYTMIQAEPNGLYTPDVSDANWIMCINPKDGRALPTFVSARVVVSPFAIN